MDPEGDSSPLPQWIRVNSYEAQDNVCSDLGSFAAKVGQDHQDKTSDVKVHQIVRWKGLQDTGNEHDLADAWQTATPGPCYPRDLEESR